MPASKRHPRVHLSVTPWQSSRTRAPATEADDAAAALPDSPPPPEEPDRPLTHFNLAGGACDAAQPVTDCSELSARARADCEETFTGAAALAALDGGQRVLGRLVGDSGLTLALSAAGAPSNCRTWTLPQPLTPCTLATPALRSQP